MTFPSVTWGTSGIHQVNRGGRVPFNEEKAAELVLALLHLTLHDTNRAWKGHSWDVLALLEQQGFIRNPRGRAKSVELTTTGLARSREMFAKYLQRAV